MELLIRSGIPLFTYVLIFSRCSVIRVNTLRYVALRSSLSNSSIAWNRPANRTEINSSKLDAAIPKNVNRSWNGISVRLYCAMTRSLKSNQDNSLSIKLGVATSNSIGTLIVNGSSPSTALTRVAVATSS